MKDGTKAKDSRAKRQGQGAQGAKGALERERRARRQLEVRCRQLEDEVRQGKKMAALGEMAAGIAHNFNNTLMGVTGNLQLLLERVAPELKPLAEDANLSAQRAAEVAHQLLLFARQGDKVSRQPVDLVALVEEVAALCRQHFDRSIEVECVLAPKLPPAVGDESQIRQILLNLCKNARDALLAAGPERHLRLNLARRLLSAAQIPAESGLAPGPYFLLTVADDGTGMSPQVQARIFEPFFTTKKPGQGTGLGLATARGAVEELGGWLACKSKAGKGTAMTLFLPASL